MLGVLLDGTSLCYRLSRHRDDTVLITVTTIAERLEITEFESGHVEFCRFIRSIFLLMLW
jgi:hypothetical protein